MHPLMAQALRLGALADGLSDPEGRRVRASESGTMVRLELLDAEGRTHSRALRAQASAEAPDGWWDELPFLGGVSCVALEEGEERTVTWPDPESGGGVAPSLMMMPDLLGGPSPRDPVTEAWQRYTAEGAGGGFGSRLESGFDGLLDQAIAAGWALESDEGVEGPSDGRVARLVRGDVVRTITLSAGLGVVSLVLMDRARR